MGCWTGLRGCPGAVSSWPRPCGSVDSSCLGDSGKQRGWGQLVPLGRELGPPGAEAPSVLNATSTGAQFKKPRRSPGSQQSWACVESWRNLTSAGNRGAGHTQRDLSQHSLQPSTGAGREMGSPGGQGGCQAMHPSAGRVRINTGAPRGACLFPRVNTRQT